MMTILILLVVLAGGGAAFLIQRKRRLRMRSRKGSRFFSISLTDSDSPAPPEDPAR